MPVFDETNDETMLRRAFAVARGARDDGEHPFGAILVGPDGTVLMEQPNAYNAEGQDMTAHAERMLATRASKRWRPDFLAGCTMFTSGEPCAMCSGAIYWAGIRRVVYALPEQSLAAMVPARDGEPMMDLPCRDVFAAGGRTVHVAGPALEEEAAVVHTDFWA